MIEDTDVIEDILAEIREIYESGFNGEIYIKLDQIEARMRQKWGGTEPYISKHKHKKKERQRAYAELQKGVPPKEVSKRTGVSRSLLYAMLRKRK